MGRHQDRINIERPRGIGCARRAFSCAMLLVTAGFGGCGSPHGERGSPEKKTGPENAVTIRDGLSGPYSSTATTRPLPEERDPQVVGNLVFLAPYSGNIASGIIETSTQQPTFVDDLSHNNLFAGVGSAPVVQPSPSGGTGNVAVGFGALKADSTGQNNVAVGFQSLASNTSGSDNVAVGASALKTSTSTNGVTVVGEFALAGASAPTYSTVAGALADQTGTAAAVTAMGASALVNLTTGSFNTALGALAGMKTTSGQENTYVGSLAGAAIVTDGGNTAAGAGALGGGFNFSGSGNTAFGSGALASLNSGSFNVAIGEGAGNSVAVGSDNIYLGMGATGQGSESATIRVGNPGNASTTFIAGIAGATSAGGVPVFISTTGQLGVMGSSIRYKEDVRDMGDDSDVILHLRPVTFRYKPQYDPEGGQQYGLIAEEVEKVAPQLVGYDREGKADSVQYNLVNAMMLNELQKLDRSNQAQAVSLARLQSESSPLAALNALAARLDKIEREARP
jgi:hypothetical protein